MVAVHAASPAPDADLASELGSLLLAHKQIVAPNWQLDAIVRRMPVVRRFRGVGRRVPRGDPRALRARDLSGPHARAARRAALHPARR